MVVLPNCGDMRSPPSRKGRRIIVVSHRLPLHAVRNPDSPYGGLDFSLDPDALSFKHSRGLPGRVVFVGTLPDAAASVPASEELTAHLLARFSCIPVFLDAELHKDSYHEFSMNYLWPMMIHNNTRQWEWMPSSGSGRGIEFNAGLYQAYIAANTRFAERVLELVVSPDEDHVYIHDDCHLWTLTSILRQRSPSLRIYFTMHTHFPSSDIFCSSPIAKDLVRSLLNADLLAFASSSHSLGYCRPSWHYRNSSDKGFLSTCSRLLNLSYQSRHGDTIIDYLDRTVVVKSIKASSRELCHEREMLSSPETAASLREVSNKYRGRKLLLDVEGDDYLCLNRCKNLLAMETLLESKTELRGQVVLVKIINTRDHRSDEVLANRDRINDRFGFPGYEPVVVIDEPPMHELLALYTLADVCIAKTLSTEKFIRYTVCRQEGQDAQRPPSAPRSGTIIGIANGIFSCGGLCRWLPTGAIQVNGHNGTAMADAMGSALRMNEEEKQLLQVQNYRHVVRKYDIGYWAESFEQDLQKACTYHQSAKRLARSFGEQISSVLLDLVSPQELNKLVTTLEMVRMEKKKVSTFEVFFSLISMNNNPGYHRADMELMQALIEASALEVIRVLKVMCLDPNNNTTSFVSGRRKDEPAMCPELDKLISADHGYSTSSGSKKATLSVRYLAQLVAACNSSASAGQSSMAPLHHPSRPPHIRFLLDSGASMHVVGDARLLRHLRRPLPQAEEARFATLPDGSRVPITGKGTIQMHGFVIPNVYLVEGLTVNLVSVGRLAMEHGICCCFWGNRCQLMVLADGRMRVVGEAVLEDDGVYGLRFLRIPGATA